MRALRVLHFVDLGRDSLESLRRILPGIKIVIELQIRLQPLPIPVPDFKFQSASAAGFSDGTSDYLLALLDTEAANPSFCSVITPPSHRPPLLRLPLRLHPGFHSGARSATTLLLRFL